MARFDIIPQYERIEKLALEIKTFVPIENIVTLEFRADLAGLLAVTIAASYENCVKETIVARAGRHNSAFADFCGKNYEKLNSKISLSDLYRYADLFDTDSKINFKNKLKIKKIILKKNWELIL
jgi:hypothetical protein